MIRTFHRMKEYKGYISQSFPSLELRHYGISYMKTDGSSRFAAVCPQCNPSADGLEAGNI